MDWAMDLYGIIYEVFVVSHRNGRKKNAYFISSAESIITTFRMVCVELRIHIHRGGFAISHPSHSIPSDCCACTDDFALRECEYCIRKCMCNFVCFRIIFVESKTPIHIHKCGRWKNKNARPFFLPSKNAR